MDELFRRGGPHNIRKTGHDQYTLNISLPADGEGVIGRECPSEDCSPAYFRVKLGTGITGEDYDKAFCPYCRTSADPNDFTRKSQVEYGKRIVENEVLDGLDRMMQKALGMGSSRKKTIGGGMFSMEMSYKPPRKKPVGRPFEEELRRDVRCPACTLEHSVFGLATWCPDCGADIFPAHLDAELDVVKKMLGHVETRREELGPRVAARDVENALEDVVSVFEAVLKQVTRRHLREQGRAPEDVEEVFRKKVRNTYQSVSRGAVLFEELVGFPLFDGVDARVVEQLEATFEKRHPITHNLGVLDRKYLDKARSGELEGREVRVTAREIEEAVDLVSRVVVAAYERAFPPAT